MPPTSTIPQSPPRPPRAPSRLPAVVAALVAGALLIVQVALALQPPERLGQLTIHNDTDYHLNTTLRASPDGSRLELGQVRRNASKTVASILDPGDTFVFELSYGGVPAGTVTVERAALEADGWELTIPADVSAPLEAAGLAPPPG